MSVLAKVPEAVRTELEFMLVLEELADDVPEKVLKVRTTTHHSHCCTTSLWKAE